MVSIIIQSTHAVRNIIVKLPSKEKPYLGQEFNCVESFLLPVISLLKQQAIIQNQELPIVFITMGEFDILKLGTVAHCRRIELFLEAMFLSVLFPNTTQVKKSLYVTAPCGPFSTNISIG